MEGKHSGTVPSDTGNCGKENELEWEQRACWIAGKYYTYTE